MQALIYARKPTLDLGAPRAHDVQAAAEQHEACAGWSGDGYTWDCKCGDASEPFGDLDLAVVDATEHLLDAGAIPAVIR